MWEELSLHLRRVNIYHADSGFYWVSSVGRLLRHICEASVSVLGGTLSQDTRSVCRLVEGPCTDFQGRVILLSLVTRAIFPLERCILDEIREVVLEADCLRVKISYLARVIETRIRYVSCQL